MSNSTEQESTIARLAELYPAHIAELQVRAKNILRREGLEAIAIHSGKPLKIFLDDQNYPFKCNPHFKHWLPLTQVTNCWLIINGEDKPKLIYFQPTDFWHNVETLPNEFWNNSFDINIIHHASDIDKHLPYSKTDIAYIGEHIEVATALGFDLINPEAVFNYLHFHRAYKTDYEQACLRQANIIAHVGHQAAFQAFIQQRGEFDIQQSYLQATLHTSSETPYQNIIALNEHAAILHYTDLQLKKPSNFKSFLIDAGASFYGYGADVTRTYTLKDSVFSTLIQQVEQLTLYLTNYLKPGLTYVDLHLEAYKGIARILCESKLITCDINTAIETNIVSTFFPHGIGHHLGLQTHDVGGLMADERGTLINSPAEHPFLRATRLIETSQVLTVEPGLYFIPSLLNELKNSVNACYVNWAVIETLLPYGGIRIEDNIIVHQLQNENISRFND